ncbi:MAG: cytidylate kinase-like family protein [Desulfobacteraceae bacterium]|nr:cytidylate kinase-like family protein [Desulfobacteraceae bacterium]
MEQTQIDTFVKEQIEKWKQRIAEKQTASALLRQVVTVSTEPGSGGRIVGEKVARQLHFDFFHRDIIKAVSESSRMSDQVIESLERERLTGVEDFISSLIKDKYMYPGDYLRHLMKVMGTIARHGRAVIVGRGANFILPADKQFSVRVICPQEERVKNVARTFDVSLEEARQRVIRRESRRRAFVRQSFNADISDPLHYDMVLNTSRIGIDAAVAAVVSALKVNVGDS